MIDFKQYEKAIKRAGEERQTSQAHVAAAREQHRAALEELEALKRELAMSEDAIREYEGDAPTEVTPEAFEKAILRQRVLAPQLRRAEAERRRLQQTWQDTERQATSAHKAAQRTILAQFDEDARRVRDTFYQQLQAMF